MTAPSRSRRWPPVAALVVALGVAAVSLGLDGWSGPKTGPLHITADPASGLEDSPVTTRISGLAAGQVVTVRLAARDAHGVGWTSSARYEADVSGVVDLATAAPTAGSYRHADEMGLFASMSAGPGTAAGAPFFWPVPGATFHLSAHAPDGRATSVAIRRLIAGPGVQMTDERPAQVGFFGEFLRPSPGTAHAGVVIFGGSEGGISVLRQAALFASHGYPTLALAYFHEPGLPASLVNVPLEYFARAMTWLGHQPGVAAGGVVLYGISRGSEAALLAGIHYPQLVRSVIASVPDSTSLCSWPPGLGPAWTLQGQPIPCSEQLGVPNPTDNSAAVIPVERLSVPVLLDCGGADRVERGCGYANAIRARFGSFPHPPADRLRLYAYPQAGHGLGGPPYSPLANDPSLAGTSPEANEQAVEKLWPNILAFLAIP